MPLIAVAFVCFVLPSALITTVTANVRVYYIAAVEVDWDYAPSGQNLATADNEAAMEYIERRKNRIGSVYKKVVYREFTDDSFTKPLPQPLWAGILGPFIKAELGDEVHIHFRNLASKGNFTIHPHGFEYIKKHEGALYLDGTFGKEKMDDAVPPGEGVLYIWSVSKLHAPSEQDDNCVSWAYHSHAMASKDIDTGLVGISIICKPGILGPNGNRLDVDRELYVYADVADEMNSWYNYENLHRCGDPNLCLHLHLSQEKLFRESNQKHHINGFIYGNHPDFPACHGENIVWYFMSLNLGIHTIHVNGQTMVIGKRRRDTVTLNSAIVTSGYMVPTNVGSWLMYSRSQDQYFEGMEAFLDVQYCGKKADKYGPVLAPSDHAGRKYFLAIEEVLWDYAPFQEWTNESESVFVHRGMGRIGSVYKKAVYREYLDETFTTPKPLGKHEVHYGLAGPPIKAMVGEVIHVVLLNRASIPYSLLAQGVAMTKENEGAYYRNKHKHGEFGGAIVIPGAVRKYTFYVPETVAPTPLDNHCITYIYHSAVDLRKDIFSGLFGPLLVCKPDTLTHDGFQKGLNKEFFLNWMVIDENLSWYIDENIHAFVKEPQHVNKEDEQFILSNQIRAINGMTFGTLPGLKMCIGDKVSWHMYGLGQRFDHHHFGFDGNTFKFDGRNQDIASVFPGTGETVLMIPDQAGRLKLHDGQLGYEAEGMYAWYHVQVCDWNSKGAPLLPPQIIPNPHGVVRRYFIAAIEDVWDYCPVKIDPVDGSDLLNPAHEGFLYVRDDGHYVGSRYMKAMYREFTDDSFTIMAPRELHLGILGPPIKGNVGDVIEIVFKNMASIPYNIVPRNLAFSDGSPISAALPTMPGHKMVYSYVIPMRSGPKVHGPNCEGSLYSSRVNPLQDTNSGLMGTVVICKAGVLDPLGHRTDHVTKEFNLAFVIFNENDSHYSKINLANEAPTDSNIYNSINGLVFGNLHGLVMHVGEHAAWYVFAMGSTTASHTVHFHGQLYLRSTSVQVKRDVFEIYGGTYETVEMLGYNPGIWLLHCHVSIHSHTGMKHMYTVLPKLNHIQGWP